MLNKDLSAKKNVFIVVSIMGQFPEMLRIAQVIKSSKQFNPIIYFNLGIPSGHSCVKTCLSQGIDILDYSFGYVKSEKIQEQQDTQNVIEQIHINSARNQDRVMRLKYFLRYRFPNTFDLSKSLLYSMRENLLQIPSCLNRILTKLKRMRKERKLIELLDIKLMIFAEDSEDYFTPQLIKLGHKRGIRSVVFPYTFANQFEFLEDALFHQRRVKGSLLNWLTAQIFPKWSYNYKGEKLLKRSPAFIFSTEIFGISPPNPWVMSSGSSDAIAVESAFMKEYYIKAGIPSEQLIELGFPSLDFLYETHQEREGYRRQLSFKHGLDVEKPWIICSVTPSQSPRCGLGFKSYQQFLDQYFKFLTLHQDVEIVFKFHPRLDIQEIRGICDKYGIKYIDEDTVELIAIADAYVASVSSTIRWALALGLPTINYDTYNYRYGDFDGAENYQVVFEFDNFKEAFKKLHEQLTTSADRKSNFQTNFAVLDGKAHKRMLDLFCKLTETT